MTVGGKVEEEVACEQALLPPTPKTACSQAKEEEKYGGGLREKKSGGGGLREQKHPTSRFIAQSNCTSHRWNAKQASPAKPHMRPLNAHETPKVADQHLLKSNLDKLHSAT